MAASLALVAAAFSLASLARAGDGSYPWPPPNMTESGQIGYNSCGTADSPNALCQTAFLNSGSDFCIFAPPDGGDIADNEEREVVYCNQRGHGARVLPAGTIKGVKTLVTPEFIQIYGTGDFRSIGVRAGDQGGELDPHGATGQGNPIGGLVYTTAFGNGIQQVKEWMNYQSATEFCFRACRPGSPNARTYCPHVYDVMGCAWVMPSDFQGAGDYETCQADTGAPPGIYGTSTFSQGQSSTPPPHPAPSSSNCVSGTSAAVSVPTGSAASSASSAGGSSGSGSAGKSMSRSASASGAASSASASRFSSRASASRSTSSAPSMSATSTRWAVVTGAGSSAPATSATAAPSPNYQPAAPSSAVYSSLATGAAARSRPGPAALALAALVGGALALLR